MIVYTGTCIDLRLTRLLLVLLLVSLRLTHAHRYCEESERREAEHNDRLLLISLLFSDSFPGPGVEQRISRSPGHEYPFAEGAESQETGEFDPPFQSDSFCPSKNSGFRCTSVGHGTQSLSLSRLSCPPVIPLILPVDVFPHSSFFFHSLLVTRVPDVLNPFPYFLPHMTFFSSDTTGADAVPGSPVIPASGHRLLHYG